jgi:hypothetical protein
MVNTATPATVLPGMPTVAPAPQPFLSPAPSCSAVHPDWERPCFFDFAQQFRAVRPPDVTLGPHIMLGKICVDRLRPDRHAARRRGWLLRSGPTSTISFCPDSKEPCPKPSYISFARASGAANAIKPGAENCVSSYPSDTCMERSPVACCSIW